MSIKNTKAKSQYGGQNDVIIISKKTNIGILWNLKKNAAANIL